MRIGMMDPADLARVETLLLCNAYSRFDDHDAKIKPELQRREVFTPDEWEAIEQHRIFIGMSEMAFRCSWATPELLDIDSIYVSKEGPWGQRGVYEYGLGLPGGLPIGAEAIPGTWPKRVYFENGVIVAFQEGSDARDSDCATFRQRTCFNFDGLISTTVSDALMP